LGSGGVPASPEEIATEANSFQEKKGCCQKDGDDLHYNKANEREKKKEEFGFEMHVGAKKRQPVNK